MNSTKRMLSPSNSLSNLKADLQGARFIKPVPEAKSSAPANKALPQTSSDEEAVLYTVDVGAAWLGVSCQAVVADPAIERLNALTASVGNAFLNLEADRLNAATALAGSAWMAIANARQAAEQEQEQERAMNALTASVGNAFLNLEADRLNAATALAGSAWMAIANARQAAEQEQEQERAMNALTASVGNAFLNLEADRLNAATALAGSAWMAIVNTRQAAEQAAATVSVGAAWLGVACQAKLAVPHTQHFDAATARAGGAFLNLYGCQVRLGNQTLLDGVTEGEACC